VIRSSLRLLLAALAAVALTACQGQPSTGPSVTPDVTSPVDGIVLSVDSAGLGDVRGFTLRPNGSETGFGFVLGDLENAAEFSPSHLAEHQASSTPIRVYFRVEGGERVVYRLEDAPAPGGS
jgi:hypothetical protein